MSASSLKRRSLEVEAWGAGGGRAKGRAPRRKRRSATAGATKHTPNPGVWRQVVNKSRRGASDWGRERAGRIAEGPRRRIAQRGGTYRSPEGVVRGEGALQEDVCVVC